MQFPISLHISSIVSTDSGRPAMSPNIVHLIWRAQLNSPGLHLGADRLSTFAVECVLLVNDGIDARRAPARVLR